MAIERQKKRLIPGAPETREKRYPADGGDGVEKDVWRASGFEAEQDIEEAEREKHNPGELQQRAFSAGFCHYDLPAF